MVCCISHFFRHDTIINTGLDIFGNISNYRQSHYFGDFVLHIVYFSFFFSNQALSLLLFLALDIISCMKFPWESTWPLRRRPCRPKYRILSKISKNACISFCYLRYLYCFARAARTFMVFEFFYCFFSIGETSFDECHFKFCLKFDIPLLMLGHACVTQNKIFFLAVVQP